MRRLARLLLAAALAMSFAGAARAASEAPRFIMVTHGAADDPFWAAVKEGAEQAAADAGASLSYRAPAGFDLAQMAELVAAAVAEKPAGLIVSIPSGELLEAPLRAAAAAGIPVISINSGFDVSASLGALLHVGQDEYEAGRAAGEAMRQRGGKKALCLNHEPGNVALDLRCKGFIDGFGGSVQVLAVGHDPDEVRRQIEEALAADADVDVVLGLNATIAGEPAVAVAKALDGRSIGVASFDTTEPILTAVAAHAAAFAIDQQPFLQGYLPVQYLILYARYGVIPVSNVSTGPRLIDAAEAARRLGRTGEPATSEEGASAEPPKPAEPDGG
jgi:simple sugar transport system substrate-binding protein